jgi:hypothetical protein
MTDARKLYANVTFELDTKETAEKYLERQELAYKYLYHLLRSSKILNDPKALNALNYTHWQFGGVQTAWPHLEQINIGLKYDFHKILINILENCYQRLIECIHFSDEVGETNEKNRIGSMALSCLSLELLERFSYFSREFCLKFVHENAGLKVIFNLINNRKIQDYCETLDRTRPSISLDEV